MSTISIGRRRVLRHELLTGSIASVATTPILPTGSSMVYDYHPASSSTSVKTVVTVTVVLGTVFFCLAVFVLYRYYMISYDRALLQRQRERAQRRERTHKAKRPGNISSPAGNDSSNRQIMRSCELKHGTIRPKSSFGSFKGSHGNRQSHGRNAAGRHPDKASSPMYRNSMSSSKFGKQAFIPSVHIDPRSSDTIFSSLLSMKESFRMDSEPTSTTRSRGYAHGPELKSTQWMGSSYSCTEESLGGTRNHRSGISLSSNLYRPPSLLAPEVGSRPSAKKWTPPENSRDDSLPSIDIDQAPSSDLSSKRTKDKLRDGRSPTIPDSGFRFLSTLSDGSRTGRRGDSRTHGSSNPSSSRFGQLPTDISSLKFDRPEPRCLEDLRSSVSTATDTEALEADQDHGRSHDA